MLVLGAGRLRQELRRYLGFLLGGHLVISLLGAVLLLLIAGGFHLFDQRILLAPTLWVAFGLVFLLLPWFLRRSFYVTARSELAALSSAIYSIGVIGSILIFRHQGLLSSSSAFAALGIGGLISSLPFVPYYFSIKTGPTGQKTLMEMLNAQWAYAKWSGPSSLLIWVPLNIFYLAIPYAGGLQGAAIFKALSNLISPVVQSNQALFMLIIPRLSQIYIEKGKATVLKYSRYLSILFITASSVYLVVLLTFGPEVLRFLYGNKYPATASQLIFAGLLPMIIGLSTIAGSSLRAMELPNKIFIAYLAGATVAATFGVLLTLFGSVLGALIGQALSYLAIDLMLAWYLVKNE
jgi:O-antigen/teichoic acid export membrane protein